MSVYKSQTWTPHCSTQSCRQPLHGSLISRLRGIFQLTKGIIVIFFFLSQMLKIIFLWGLLLCYCEIKWWAQLYLREIMNLLDNRRLVSLEWYHLRAAALVWTQEWKHVVLCKRARVLAVHLPPFWTLEIPSLENYKPKLLGVDFLNWWNICWRITFMNYDKKYNTNNYRNIWRLKRIWRRINK